MPGWAQVIIFLILLVWFPNFVCWMGNELQFKLPVWDAWIQTELQYWSYVFHYLLARI